MNKEFFKSVLLAGLIVLTVVMTKNLLASKTPDAVTTIEVSITDNESSLNIERIIYPQDFIIGFGGGSYTGVYSEETRDKIWNLITDILPAYLSQLNLEVVDEEEFRAIEKTRSVQLRLPFSMSLNDFGDVYQVESDYHEFLNNPIKKILVSSSQQNRIYFSNDDLKQYFYLKGALEDERLSTIINKASALPFTEYRRVDSLINFKAIKEDEVQSFHNEEIIPITSTKEIPFIKVTKEIDVSTEYQDSEVKTFLIKAFGNSTDFIKRLEEIDGSQTYIYGYGDKALRLGVGGEISYQEKIQASTETNAVSFKEGLDIALKFIEGYGNTPNSLYLSDYQVVKNDVHELKAYYFDYRVRDLNVYTKNKQGGHALEIVLTDDLVTKFTKNVRWYVKSINTSEIWSEGPVFIETLINNNFDIVSQNFNQDNKINVMDGESNWRMTTYVLRIMQSLRNVELTYYLDSELDNERLIPAWRLDIADTRYYFHVYTGDVLQVEKIGEPKEISLSRR